LQKRQQLQKSQRRQQRLPPRGGLRSLSRELRLSASPDTSFQARKGERKLTCTIWT
jgi:hypothetical protein